MLEESLRYPLNSDDRVATHIIGALLIFPGALLILPTFVLQGYLVRVLRSSVYDEVEAPSFTNWGTLFVDGVKLLIVNLVFIFTIAILFFFVYIVFFGGLTPINGAGTGSGAAAIDLVSILLLAVVGPFAIAASYFLPAMFANFAFEGRLGAAFDLSTVKSVAFTTDYFIAVLLAVVLGGAINTIAAPLSFALIGLPLLFYGQVVTYYLFGRAYAEGRVASGLSPAVGASRTTTDRSGGV